MELLEQLGNMAATRQATAAASELRLQQAAAAMSEIRLQQHNSAHESATLRSLASSSRHSSNAGSSVGSAVSSWKEDGLLGALQVMGLRSLMTMMRHMSPPQAEEERALMDQVIHSLKESKLVDGSQTAGPTLSSHGAISADAVPVTRLSEPDSPLAVGRVVRKSMR